MKSECERCGRGLEADGQALICSYECTFCAQCGEAMEQRCPNCGGQLLVRPPREPAQ